MQSSEKYRAYGLLYELIQKRDDALNQFLGNYNFAKGLPKFEIPWITCWVQAANRCINIEPSPDDDFKISAQVSYF